MAPRAPRIPLPTDWPSHVKKGILHVIALARVALTAARASSKNRGPVARLHAKVEEQAEEISRLEEELRLKDLRMGRLKPRRRPHYRGVERLAILELKAARGWSRSQTAERFQLSPPTIRGWLKKIDEGGEDALVQTPEPINRFPDFVRHIVCRLKVVCPRTGKKGIAQTLARAGLQLGVSTVGRMLKECGSKGPKVEASAVDGKSVGEKGKENPVKADHPNHVWQIDLTVVPTAAGFWIPWLPFSIAQRWPFAWWVACVVDHYSRRVMGFTVFPKEPKSVDVRAFLGRLVNLHGAPKYLVSDKGGQFDNADYKAWCDRRGMEPRYASTGSLRATAIIERFFLSLKDEWLRRIFVPLRREDLRREIILYLTWFAEFRPHQGLDGRTPNEVFEERPAVEQAKPKAKEIPRSELVVRFHEGRRQLPIVELRRAA